MAKKSRWVIVEREDGMWSATRGKMVFVVSTVDGTQRLKLKSKVTIDDQVAWKSLSELSVEMANYARESRCRRVGDE